jgi:capsular exopolysaccharide synthesis family protein
MSDASHDLPNPTGAEGRAIRRLTRSKAPKQPTAADEGLGLADLVQMLKQWGWQCTLAGLLLCAIAVAVTWAVFEPVYVASAFMEIRSVPPYIAYPDETQSRTYAQTQLETIKSPIVLSKVAGLTRISSLDQAKAAKSVEAWLSKYLTAEYVNRSELCMVSFQTTEPEAAKDVANAVVERYMTIQRDQQTAQTKRILDELEKQQKDRKSLIEIGRRTVRELTKKTTGRDPIIAGRSDTNVVIHNNPYLVAEEQLIKTKVNEALLLAEGAALEDVIKKHDIEDVVTDKDLERAVKARPEVVKLRQELEAMQIDVNTLRQASARDSFDAFAATKLKQIETTRDAIDATMVDLEPEVREKLKNDLKQLRERERVSNKLELDRVRILKAEWDSRCKEELLELETHAETVLVLEFARADLARDEEVHARISERMIALTTERQAPSRVANVQDATAPTEPLEVLPVKILSVACLASFVFPFGLAFLWERRVRRISDSRRVTGEAKVPVLAEIASLPSRLVLADRAQDGFTKERITFEESVDALRVSLMLSPKYRDVQTLAITSAASREGKTSLASSLAISLAQACNDRILLVDADMRAPDLHEIFGAAQAPGLAEVLSREAERDAALVRDVAPNVDLLPAGHLGANPHLLLRHGAMEALLADAKTKYRYVVVDCPPVLTASESLVIANASDGTLLCTRCDFSRASRVRAASERLADSGARLLGAVISAVPTRVWAQRSGGYGYGWEQLAEARE